jgi:hypothetical protein
MSTRRIPYHFVVALPHKSSSWTSFTLWLLPTATVRQVIGTIVYLELTEGWCVWHLIHNGRVLSDSCSLCSLEIFPEEQIFVQTRCTRPNRCSWDPVLLPGIEECVACAALDRCFGSPCRARILLGGREPPFDRLRLREALLQGPIEQARRRFSALLRPNSADYFAPWERITEEFAIDSAIEDPRLLSVDDLCVFAPHLPRAMVVDVLRQVGGDFALAADALNSMMGM